MYFQKINSIYFYYLDINRGISSNFDKVSDDEINKMISNINNTHKYYKSLGFDEVYLSVIPNKTSILGKDLGEYNRLIERVESNASLKMPIISVFKEFQAKDLYLKGDSHWNCEGQQIWIDKVNNVLLEAQ